MAVDLLSGVRSANAQLIPVLQANAAARERERQRQALERQNRAANILALGGAVAGGMIAGPPGIAAGATLGNMAGRAAAGGPAPSVAETANVGASLYGLYGDSQQAAANAEINKALTSKAISELASGVPEGMTPESASAARATRDVKSLLGPGIEAQAGVNVAAGPAGLEPAASDERIGAVLGPTPTPQQQRTLESIKALQGLQSQNLGRISPQTVAAVTQAFLPHKQAPMKLGPGDTAFDVESRQPLFSNPKEGSDKPLTFWTRESADKPWQVRTATTDKAVGTYVGKVGEENVTLKDPTDRRSGEVTVAKDLRGEYRKDIGTFNDAQEAVRNIMSAQPNVAGDTSLVYNIARLNDPNGRAVTDSDIRVNALNGNYGLQVKNWMESVLATGTLSTEARQQVKQQAVRQYENRYEEFQRIKGRTERLAERFGVDKTLVVYDDDLAIDTPQQLKERLNANAPDPQARKEAKAIIGAPQTNAAAKEAAAKLTPKQLSSLKTDDVKTLTPMQRKALNERLKEAGF